MKRVLSCLLIVATLFLTVSCGQSSTYPPVKSTDEEARVVMTLSLDGKTYDVKYELYRAFFLTYKSDIDGGDSSVWSGPDAARYREQIDALIEAEICKLYAVLALCDRIKYNLYSKTINDLIAEYIRIGVEGGFIDDVPYTGYGTYDAYLAALKANYLNYSVQDLLYRYSAGISALNYYYAGDTDAGHPGAIEYTAEDLRAFYDADTTARATWFYFSMNSVTADKTAEQRAAEAHDAMQAIIDSGDNVFHRIVHYILGHSIQAEAEVKNGNIITRYSMDSAYYADLTEAALALSVGELSQPVRIQSDTFDGYFIVYRMEKTGQHYTDCKDDVLNAYLQDQIGKMLADAESALAASRADTDVLRNLDFAAISMD